MWDYLFGDVTSALCSVFIILSIILFFTGDKGSNNRKLAGYCLGFVAVVSVFGHIYARHDLSRACHERGDSSACDELDVMDYNDEQQRDAGYR